MCQVLTETVKDTIAILVPKSVFPYCEIFYLQCQLLFSRYSTVYVVESIYILTIVYYTLKQHLSTCREILKES